MQRKAAKLIPITLIDGNKVLINPRHIDMIENDPSAQTVQTKIKLNGGQVLLTDLSTEDIQQQFYGKQQDDTGRVFAIY